MRGQEPLIAMRLAHRKPAFVAINVGSESDWWSMHWHEWQGSLPHLWIEPTDAVARLDLRCLVGLTVDVSGHLTQADRVRAVCQACEEAGAIRVIGALYRIKGEEVNVVEYTDTAGVLTWQA